MLPKNKSREWIIKKNLHIITGPYHNYHSVGLPQFSEPVPEDLNETLGLNDHDSTKIIFSSGQIPEEYKDLPVEIDENIAAPYYSYEKTHKTPKSNYILASKLRGSFKTHRKYKNFRA